MAVLGNLVQFLTGTRSDGGQLAYTDLASFDPLTLAVAGSTTASVVETSVWAASITQPGASVSVDTIWGGKLKNVDVEIGPLGHELAQRGVPEPEDDQIGYELGDEGWMAEIAWPSVRVAIVVNGPESAECLAAYTKAEWDARLARDWSPDELAGKIAGVGGTR